MDYLKGYKTIIFNVLMGAVIVANQLGVGLVLSEDDVTNITNALVVLGNIVLRFTTDTPVGEK